MDVPIYNIKGEEINRIQLDNDIFAGDKAVLYQAINMYRANRRAGTASTKTRAYVRGGGKKPWRQKHTGRARAGSIRSPLWRGGGKVFGPHPRRYFYSIPLKIKRRALTVAFREKIKAQEFFIADGLEDTSLKKTKDFAPIIRALCKNSKCGKVLVVLSALNTGTALCLRNLDSLTLSSANALNAFDILNHTIIIVSMPAWENLRDRLCKNGRIV